MIRLPESMAKTFVRPNVVVEFYVDRLLSTYENTTDESRIRTYSDYVDGFLRHEKFVAYTFLAAYDSSLYNHPLWTGGIPATDELAPLQLDYNTIREIAEYIARVCTTYFDNTIHVVVRSPMLRNLPPYY